MVSEEKRSVSYILKIALGGVALFVIIVGGIYGIKSFIKHENLQDEKIADLQIQIDQYRKEHGVSRPDIPDFTEDSYNYLAIGNSITKHPICDYWWNEIGMAASREENDYVHLITERLGADVEMYALNFYIWEIQSADRAETLMVLEPYLSQNLDLVTVQLGENVTDRGTLEKDYEELIRFIQDRCPDAQILLVGGFWEAPETDGMKVAAASRCSIDFVDLSLAWSHAEYKVGLGSTVYGSDEQEHVVEHEGVAGHPGDKGMEFIAESILEFVEMEHSGNG